MTIKMNVKSIQNAKLNQEILTWLTCYDYSFAKMLNETGLDMILVGDSGGMVSLGYEDTIPVSMNEMIQMCSSVRRGAPDKFLVGDMPKGSYESSDSTAIENAMRFVKESGVDAVKLEGGVRMAKRVDAIVNSGISVIGHVGLTPQSIGAFGGYRVTGRSSKEREIIFNDVESLINAGAVSILLEATPPNIAKEISKKSQIPIFGIGAGSKVDGQLLILHDLLGLYPNFRPKFAKNYIPSVLDTFSNKLNNQDNIYKFGRDTRRDGLYELSRLAVEAFIRECKNRQFPNSDFEYSE